MRLLIWPLWALVFFTLFAFALNNQQAVTLHWFFGYGWTAPMVVITLAAFGAGTVFGVLAMTPSWWKQWRLARHPTEPVTVTPAPGNAPSPPLAPPARPADPSPTEPHGI
jgi:uncharacterized integral membrane protein